MCMCFVLVGQSRWINVYVCIYRLMICWLNNVVYEQKWGGRGGGGGNNILQ